MQKKIISSVVGMVLLGVVFLGLGMQDNKAKGTAPSSSRKTNALVFDRSIKAEYGKPIKVLRIVDGDTIELVNGERIRYIGIDTPEEVDPRKSVQCFAREAAEKNKELVEGKTVMFYKDVSVRDKYDRLLGFVYLADGTFVNLELVRQGFAFSYPYPPDISKAAEFRAAEAYARENNLGLWAGCTINHSGDRSQTNTLQ